MENFIGGGSRLDFGFGNPNKTAALLCMVIVAVWGISTFFRKGFWISLFMTIGLGVCLLKTGSRGGIVAIVCGLLPLIASRSHPWPRVRVIAIISVCGFMFFLAAQCHIGHRITPNYVMNDGGIGARISMYAKAPLMMLDAPRGWGFGNAADAYIQWYQPVNDLRAYKNLLNSHLTWLVEMNWGCRFGYIFAWISILFLCTPFKGEKQFAAPLGIWIAFGVSASFSAVADSVWLWVIPASALANVVVLRIRHQYWLDLRHLLMAVTASSVLIFSIIFVGWISPRSTRIIGEPKLVMIGDRAPETWIVSPDTNVLGSHYGHSVRTSNMSVGIVKRVQDIPAFSGGHLILMRNSIQEQPSASFSRIILLNPAVPQGWVREVREQKFRIVIGEFQPQHIKDAWTLWVNSHTESDLVLAHGCAEYIPDWTEYVR